MKTNPLPQDLITENSAGIGIVTREMIRIRAAELAFIDGRSRNDLSKSDLEQAKRELMGKTELAPKEVILESATESERWDPLPGSTGHKAQEIPGDDEDDEGRSNSEHLVEQGVNEAAHDQMLQAARATREDK